MLLFKKIKVKEDDVFKNKLEIADSSKAFFRKNPTLIFYPIIGALLSICIFVLLISLTKGSGAVVFALIIWYLFFHILIAFFNTATISNTKLHYEGSNPSFSLGIGEAFKRTHLIINWAFFYSIIGLFINLLAELKLGKKFAYSGEIRWSFVNYFVLPIIVYENKNVNGAIDESQKLIKKNWGKNLSGEYKISFVSIIPFIFILSILIFSSVLKDEFITYGLFILTIFVFLVGYFINLTLRSIFYTTLYANAKSKSKK